MLRKSALSFALTLGLYLVGGCALAQDVQVNEVAPEPPFSKVTELAPFIGRYSVTRNGQPAGQANMRLVNTQGNRWRVDLDIQGTQGVAALAGVHIQQSTVFEVAGTQYRPLSQSTTRKALLRSRRTVGRYDWQSRTASWQGDVKESRRGRTIALQDGDMSGLLINLALVRDARPGAQLSYRFVDDGRLRRYDYRAAETPENLVIQDLSYDALRLDRSDGGQNRNTVWVASGSPLPVRIVIEDDETLDLQLVQYRGN